jgi:large subunit ribosomal protein L10
LANKEAKAPLIEDLADRLGRCSIAILTDYRGMRVGELAELRRRLRTVNVEYRIAKNTMTRFAAERVGKTAIHQDLEGPTAIAFAYDDPGLAARTFQDYVRTARLQHLSVKSAILGERRLAPAQLQALADLPGQPQLQARLVGTVQGPLASLVGSINGLLSQLAYVVDQRAQQLGGAGAQAAESPA